jgi:hypothetical protein
MKSFNTGDEPEQLPRREQKQHNGHQLAKASAVLYFNLFRHVKVSHETVAVLSVVEEQDVPHNVLCSLLQNVAGIRGEIVPQKVVYPPS